MLCVKEKNIILLQAMDELTLDAFKYGGVNITGFRLVSPESKEVQGALRDWSRLNPNYWKGAGTSKLQVRTLCYSSFDKNLPLL